jgi:hypothetical protein
MIGLLFKLCIVVTPSNIISKFKHYKGIVIAILFEPEDPLDMTTAPLSPSIAMPVLNDKPPLTPAKPALAVERLAAPKSPNLSPRHFQLLQSGPRNLLHCLHS